MKFLLIFMVCAFVTNVFASEELQIKAHAHALSIANQMNEEVDLICISESALTEEESQSTPERRAYFFPFGKFSSSDGCPDASRGVEVVVLVESGELIRAEVYND